MHTIECHHRVRHGLFVALELLVLTLLIAGLSWTLMKTVARANLRAAQYDQVETALLSMADRELDRR